MGTIVIDEFDKENLVSNALIKRATCPQAQLVSDQSIFSDKSDRFLDKLWSERPLICVFV